MAYPDTTFTLCASCVPAELLPTATPLPGGEDVEDLLQLLIEQYSTLEAHAGAR